ncbi:hypothetical protein PG991_013461 [Apiospora marii]|uniref:Uncharacterized protein n=1 Tax=Apiospora marii TaxID=335849 RepID=A0ABR1R626_9PEZI
MQSFITHLQILVQQQLRKSSSAAAGPTAAHPASASDPGKPLTTGRRQSKSRGPSRSLGARDDHADQSERPKHAPDPAGKATAPAAASPALDPLPGQIARLLNLVDMKRSPLISFLPDEKAFVRPQDKPTGECFEYRKTINPDPNHKYKIKLYHQLRSALVKTLSVFQRRFRGALQSGQHRMFSINKAISELHGALGLARDWALDEWRMVSNVIRSQPFERDNTDATLETLPDGRAGLLWVNIVPQRCSHADRAATETPSTHFRWASDWDNLPWNTLKNVLETAPNGTLKVPTTGPASGAYEVWTEKKPGLPSGMQVADKVIFMHVMPLFMKTYGPGGHKAWKLWGKDRHNENLPVVFSWQEKYVWCIWRNGPHGPLEMQQTGCWVPEVAPGTQYYETERELLESIQWAWVTMEDKASGKLDQTRNRK